MAKVIADHLVQEGLVSEEDQDRVAEEIGVALEDNDLSIVPTPGEQGMGGAGPADLKVEHVNGGWSRVKVPEGERWEYADGAKELRVIKADGGIRALITNVASFGDFPPEQDVEKGPGASGADPG